MRKATKQAIVTGIIGYLGVSSVASAALIVNAAQTIRQRVGVRVIQVASTSGTNAAPLFGTPAQQTTIFNMIDQVWAQAGIDIDIRFRPGTYNNTFALTGTAGANSPRPTGDLNTIRSNATAAGGVIDPDPTVLNLFVTRIVPGFSQTSDNTSNGLAFIAGNGITFWAGPSLPAFAGGQDVLASVLAHEIGHNLGLSHIVEAQNLLQSGGSPNQGERLNAAQISTAKNISFSVVYGDSDLDKDVDFADLVILAQNYNLSTALGIAKGDFNRDGIANFADLVLLAQNYNFSLATSAVMLAGPTGSFDEDWAAALAIVPEPTTATVFAIAATVITCRRRVI